MRRLLHTLAFVLVSTCAFSQVPGYQGKVFSAGIGFSSFPGVFTLPADYVKSHPETTESFALFSFHKKYEGHANYVFSRKSMVGLTGKYYNNVVMLNNNGIQENTLVGTDAQGDPIIAATIFTFTENLFFNVYQVGVSYSLFGSGYVAPLGKSVSIEYGRIFYSNANPTVNSFSDQFVDLPTLYKEFDVDVSENVGYIGVGYSSSRVFFNRLIGSAGLDLNLVLGGERGLLNLAGEVPVYDNISDLTASLARKNIRRQNYINIKLGLAFLIF